MVTRNGVCYDLFESPFTYTSYDSNQFLLFIFSSKSHLEKFVSRLPAYRAEMRASLRRRFNLEVDFSELIELSLYRKIESRGFLIKVSGEWITCPDNLLLDGQLSNKNNSRQTLDDLMPN